MPEVGTVFKKNEQLWEVIKYDYIEDSYLCHNLSSNTFETKKFNEEEMEEKK